jgi:hypothetical protein
MQEEGLEEGDEMPRMPSADPPVPRKDLLVPEKDYEFDSSMRFRRKTQAENAPLEPIVHQTSFLRRGLGHGGSPTNFAMSTTEDKTLVPMLRMAK